MTEYLQHWWRDRTPREQALLLAMLVLAGGLAAWMLVVRPLDAALDQAKTRHAQAVNEWAQVNGRLDAPPVPSDEVQVIPSSQLLPLVRADAAEAGFANAQIVPRGPGAVDVAIPSARSPAAFAWLAGIERKGAEIAEVHVATNGDRTVRLRLRLEAGARE